MINIYCYERGKICDLVFVEKDFGVIAIEHYPITGEFLKEIYRDIEQYESTLELTKLVKTFIGTV